jgi:transposase
MNGRGPLELVSGQMPSVSRGLRALTEPPGWGFSVSRSGEFQLSVITFVPPEPIRHLRDLTRTRSAITRERAREVQRLEKLLEDSGIKLSSVASEILGVSGRAMLEALIDGQRDPAQLAELAKRRLRSKIPALTEALTGRFSAHHAFLARMHLVACRL